MPILTTRRLRLRPWCLEDVPDMLAMDMDADVVRYIWGTPPDPEKRHWELVERIHASSAHPGGNWIVEWRDDPRFLGWCGLIPLEDSGYIEIGYRYIKAAWGQGIATEAAQTVLDHGFRALEIDPIVAVTHPENRASQNVLTKIGLNREGLQFHYGRDLPFFRLTCGQHLKRSP